MKQIYTIVFLFFPFWCLSQLYISPKQGDDSFLYVEGDLLFVNKEIGLRANPSGTASLYLRDEAQLIQGSNNFTNKGDGLLSVFQEGKASAYSYNYWSSPVESSTGDNSFGKIFFEPITTTHSTPAGITSGYNGSSQPLQISNRWIYTLSGADYSDWRYVGVTFDVVPGEGFTMKGVDGTNNQTVLYGVANNPGNAQRYDFRGRPHTGNVILSIVQHEIKLVGNPYPSALDLNSFLLENTATTGIAYFWDSNPVPSHYLQDYEGGYGAYSPVAGYAPAVFLKYDNSGIPVDFAGGTGEDYSRQFSPIAQGFVVEGLSSGNIIFKNDYRTFIKENPDSSQFKASLTEKEVEEMPPIRLNIDFNGNYVRQLLLAFRENSSSGVDRAMDARNIMPLATDAGWDLADDLFLINVRPWDELEKIPLLFSLSEESEISVEVARPQDLSTEFYLYDSHHGVYYDIRNGKIEMTLSEGSYSSRFFLAFSAEENKLTEDLPPEYSIIQNTPLKRLEVITPEFSSPDEIALFDLSGRKISDQVGRENRNYYEVSTSNLSRGMYILKIKTPEGYIISKKVIISN